MKKITDPLELLDIFGGEIPLTFEKVNSELKNKNCETTVAVYQTALQFQTNP
jgi:hypothetical protein